MHSGREWKSLYETFKASSLGKPFRIAYNSSFDKFVSLRCSVLKFGQPFAIECLSLNLLNDCPICEHPSTNKVSSFGNKNNFLDILSFLQP